ncbi:MAG: RNase adapter RapZ [Galactobacillus timonensis]|uniref:RNase adapter RapZ n=1 Tax=Galactobacillus timonensis TaxID=2041840 RepID=UPI000C81AE30|nr:RNase adapter RapZ [Galactobacillus timonensis]MDY5222120.1 RNase adapter RapZ [Lachnospiraceae bacterium]MDY6281666.1 RNase adapter RapZ [Erysipelotrichaceae bacterium]MCI6754077.1 RNase adapter RapZ [Galactobacillus timonensis]MDD5850687.1 RNase adapter RapZ [Galactobacillus timonensis]MDD6369584.1 RNase adapter RapZ [Galactobacillus timonensis]
MEKTKHVVLVSGMSGAGKSTAMSILEDMGYHVIENFPIQLLSLLVDMIETSTDPRYSYIALSTSAADFPVFLRTLKGQGIEVRVMFLDAADSVLIHRYKQTRRIHPLLLSNTANTLEEAIAVERQMLSQTNNSSFVTIDTSFTSAHDIKQMIEQYFSKDAAPSFSISFVSFGYKYGVPMDADLMIDVRFLPNPYWEPKLRIFSGNDDNVYHYVMDKPETQEFLKRLLSFLDYSFAQYVKEGKNHFTVAIGCTGGQHRSVAITNFLYDHYKTTYHVYKSHRDEKEWLTHE